MGQNTPQRNTPWIKLQIHKNQRAADMDALNKCEQESTLWQNQDPKPAVGVALQVWSIIEGHLSPFPTEWNSQAIEDIRASQENGQIFGLRPRDSRRAGLDLTCPDAVSWD